MGGGGRLLVRPARTFTSVRFCNWCVCVCAGGGGGEATGQVCAYIAHLQSTGERYLGYKAVCKTWPCGYKAVCMTWPCGYKVVCKTWPCGYKVVCKTWPCGYKAVCMT